MSQTASGTIKNGKVVFRVEKSGSRVVRRTVEDGSFRMVVDTAYNPRGGYFYFVVSVYTRAADGWELAERFEVGKLWEARRHALRIHFGHHMPTSPNCPF